MVLPTTKTCMDCKQETFEDWWEKNWPDFPHMNFAREIWNAATAVERQRCREVVTTFVGKYLCSMTVKEIADEIGE